MSSTPSAKEWLILQCQACGAAMKVRAGDVAGRRVACPSCRSPVAVQVLGNQQSPEFRAPMAQDGDRIIADTARLRQLEEYQQPEEFAPSPGNLPLIEESAPPAGDDTFLRNLKSTDDYHSGGHIKVKKRRRKGATGHRDILTDWDTTLETLPEAELYSDPWTESVPIPEEVIKEKSRDFVVSEHREDGNTVRRVKRVRKRRLFTWAQLFFRRLSLGMRVFTIAIVSSIALGGLALGVVIFRDHFKPVTFEDVVAESRLPQEFITSQDESSATGAVKSFLASVGTGAKLKHVRLPARVKPLMEAWYARTPDRPLNAGEVKSFDKIRSGDQYLVLLEMEVIDPARTSESYDHKMLKHFAVEETETGGVRTYRVDWETAVEWRVMSFEEFKATRPAGNVPFRVKLRASNYYNHEFADEKKWLATEIYFPHPQTGNEKLFHGYLERGTRVFNDIAPITGSGRNPAMIVNLRYPANSISRDQVIIDSVVLDSWFYSEDVPPGRENKPAYR